MHGLEVSSRSIGLSPADAGRRGRLPLVWFHRHGPSGPSETDRTPPKPLNDAQTWGLLAPKCWHTLCAQHRILRFDSQQRPMARFRIVQSNSCFRPGIVVFGVEERFWFWWDPRGLFYTIAEAERFVAELKAVPRIERKVIKEYN